MTWTICHVGCIFEIYQEVTLFTILLGLKMRCKMVNTPVKRLLLDSSKDHDVMSPMIYHPHSTFSTTLSSIDLLIFHFLFNTIYHFFDVSCCNLIRSITHSIVLSTRQNTYSIARSTPHQLAAHETKLHNALYYARD